MMMLAQEHLKHSKLGWQLWQRLARLGRRIDIDDVPESEVIVVRLTDVPGRKPQTAYELEILAMLKQENSVSLNVLVRRVAEEMYQDELRRGAAVAEIGLFGSRLFHRDVLAAIQSGDGILWKAA